MDLNKRKLLQAYDPYKREAIYCFCLDILISICCGIAFSVFAPSHLFPFVYLVFPLYFLLELVFNYSLFLLGIIEQRNHLYIKKQLRFLKITEEHSLSGHWGSIIPKLYPKQMMVGRYKLRCINDHGKNKSSHYNEWKKIPEIT